MSLTQALSGEQRMLEETHVVVISGVPVIGKTTLADTMLYAHLEQGYEPVVIHGGIAEAKKLFDKPKNQIFYFDDFRVRRFSRAGQNSLTEIRMHLSFLS